MAAKSHALLLTNLVAVPIGAVLSAIKDSGIPIVDEDDVLVISQGDSLESLINRRKNRSNRNSDEIRQKKSVRFSGHSVLQRRIRSPIKTLEIPTQDEIFIEFRRGER
ncbi:uncharacterized protein A4U43_C06F15060 [Asparagus officinalis]|uniref:Uncharacterized protein n=1 Tax=Asparagus officinalis TaxID=4686 RepID=A0A5P1EN08_ASPOF|nr:uncharacterized protein A4U43_C06F15060 [Asparagus officinalis]